MWDGPPTRFPTARCRPLSRNHDIHPDECLAAFSPDGRLVAFADGGNLAGMFETATGKALNPVPSHTGRVLWIRFSRGGQRLATTGSEGPGTTLEHDHGRSGRPGDATPGRDPGRFQPRWNLSPDVGGAGVMRLWDGENAVPLTKEFDMRRGVESFVLGPDPLRVVYYLKDQAMAMTWDVTVEEHSVDEIEALSIALSGHLIDSGEGLSLASPERVEAARTTLVRREPAYFTVFVSRPSLTPPAGQPRP